MATNFPASLDSLTNPAAGDSLSSPSHSAQHANVNDAVEALQAKVGVDSSAVTGSLDYKVANQGLTLVKSQTIGSGVSSVTVTGAFSSTFDNYKVTVEGTSASGSSNIMITLGSSATGSAYYGSFYYDAYTGTNTGTARSLNASRLYLGAMGTLEETFCDITISRPYLAERTQFVSLGYGNGISGWAIGTNAASTSFTSFTISAAVGTMTDGTIRVYGYNNG
jgi:hypothetical protein